VLTEVQGTERFRSPREKIIVNTVMVRWTSATNVDHCTLVDGAWMAREFLADVNRLGGHLREMEDVSDEEAERIARQPVHKPIDQELFNRTAPAWNCVAYPNDGMHYLHPLDGSCQWCGKSREALAREKTS
jgi:hypothetical protein